MDFGWITLDGRANLMFNDDFYYFLGDLSQLLHGKIIIYECNANLKLIDAVILIEF